jgi:DNA-binding NtrC family response regulator
MISILVADDEKSLSDFLVIMLEEEGYQVVTSSSVEKATKLICEIDFDLLLTDIRMGLLSGVDILDAARNALLDILVVMMTAYASAETAVTAMKKGAFTSADSMKLGLMESASKGSLFFDEVGNASLSTKVKLLRVLQENEIVRLGGTQLIPIDLRIIAAIKSNLSDLV